MCLVHSPSAPAAPPPPTYLHNPYLDGSTMGMGGNSGRNSLVTLGRASMPAVVNKTPTNAPAQPGLSAPSGGTTLPPGTIPQMGQPGMVIPTVGGVMAGVMGGRVTSPTAPPARAMAK